METINILIADDEPGMRLGVSRTLRDFSVRVPDVNGEVRFSIADADSGEAALESIAKKQPDILLLDFKMPGISGLEVLDRIAGRYGDMLTIMITAYASIETAVTATKRGAYDFLAKPFTPDELKSTIRKAAVRVILAKQAHILADEKRRVRFEFIRVLGHELKTPLNALEGYLRMFKERTLGDDPASYDESIDRSLLRIDGMRKLIADLLDMTRIESGEKNRQIADIDLSDIAHSVFDALSAQATERNIVLQLHAPASLPIKADRGEMEMILSNLISNAVKYNCDNGRVDVSLDKKDGILSIAVTDTGIGMTPEEVQQLFGEFARIKNEKTTNILGSGLGLSIVKKLTQLYGGEIQVTSQPDQGSTFTVTLKEI